MSTAQLVALVLAAVIVFWMLGAYNRLMALRGNIARAFAQVDDALQRRSAAALALADVLRTPLAVELGALEAVPSADAAVAQASALLRNKPPSSDTAQAMVVAQAAMASALSRLTALVEQRSELAASPEVAPHLASLREADTRIQFARQLFNDAVDDYNAACAQFPTRTLLTLYGLRESAHV